MSNPGRGIPQFQAHRYGFDTKGNDVNAGPWANLVADIKSSQLHPRGAHIVFPDGDICLNNVTLDTAAAITLNGGVTIEAQGQATRIFPGGNQGMALTVAGGSPQLDVLIRDMKLGYGSELAAVDLQYSQPILNLKSCRTFKCERIAGYLGGTGTLVHLDSTYNGSLDGCVLNGNKYGLPLLFDLASVPTTQADSIALRSSLLFADHCAFFNAGVNNLEFDQAKLLKQSTSTYTESHLATIANAGATAITLNAGDGVNFAADDVIAIDISTGASGGFGIEINKLLSIAGDVLTLAWPLRYTHDPANHYVQVVRGGIATSLGPILAHKLHDSHFEGHDTAILTNNGNGLALDNNSHQCNRYLRIAGNLNDVQIGSVLVAGAPPGAPTSNIVLDVPAYNGQVPRRIAIDGPMFGGTIQATVNYKGTSYNIDSRGYLSLAPGAGFANGPWLVPGAKLGREGIRFKGLMTMAAAVAAGATVFQMPAYMAPYRSALTTVYQVNTQSASATPAPNSLWVQGSDQGANAGLVTMRVASTAAGYLSLDSVAPITDHQS